MTDELDRLHGSEFVVQPNGTVRQAGAETGDTPFIAAAKQKAERSLYYFAKAILGRHYLVKGLHDAVCQFLLDFSKTRRKGLLLPRECAKTTLVSHALPLHILIQPKEANVYIPGESGREQRIVLACETQARGKDHLEVQRKTWVGNQLLRALWPDCVWEKPSRDASRWNNIEYDIPRTGDWPDPSVRAIGVDGAITGAHPTVLIKDDLISVEAANSPAVMQAAIEWHRTSRALVNQAKCLEFIIGTRWAVHDLYSDSQQTDPSVQWMVKQLIEDGQCIYPPPAGPFSPEKIAELQGTFGTLFLLLYMNSAADPALADFDLTQLRTYHFRDGMIELDDDPRDLLLRRNQDPIAANIAEAQRAAQEDRGRTLQSYLSQLSDREARRMGNLTRPNRVAFS